MSNTLKPILSDGYFVRPIITHKSQHYSYIISGSDNPENVSVDVATIPPDVHSWRFDSSSEAVNPDGTYQRVLYSSINHMFYRTGSVWSGGRTFTIPSGSSFYVLNFGQQTYGEKIKPGSFSLTVGSSTGSIVDDGNGNLVTQRAGEAYYELFDSGGNFAATTGVQMSHTASMMRVEARIYHDSWISPGSSTQSFIGGSSTHYHMGIRPDGRLNSTFVFPSASGAIAYQILSDPLPSGSATRWVGYEYTDDGSFKFLYSDQLTSDPTNVNWTQLGSTQTIGSGSRTHSTFVIAGQSNNFVGSPFDGKIYRARWINNGFVTCDLDFTDINAYNSDKTQITAKTGQVFTFNGTDYQVVEPSTSAIMGNISYGLGLATIKRDTEHVGLHQNGLNLTSGSVLDINFKATHTIYEHSIMCTIPAGELNYTTNKSISGSIMLSGSGKIVDALASGTLTPYMTTVGLYNNQNQLLAIAKFPRAIKRASESDQTFIIRFDV